MTHCIICPHGTDVLIMGLPYHSALPRFVSSLLLSSAFRDRNLLKEVDAMGMVTQHRLILLCHLVMTMVMFLECVQCAEDCSKHLKVLLWFILI